MIKKLLILPLVMSLSVGVCAQRADNYKPTSNRNVKLTRTNLPIVFMNVNGKTIQREDRITAWCKIIDNGDGQYNYGDTIAHPGQTIDYEGYVGLKYRGNSSFNSSEKKPYSFRPFDKPVEEGGKKQKVEIMGMGKDNDWALLAPFSDKSMIRDVLTFELARPYFDFVPHAKYCELILDGTYYGIYIMAERVGKGKKRLDLHDPGEDAGDLTGDYHVEIDRNDEPNFYRSKYRPEDGNGNPMNDKYITYQYKNPEYEDFAELPAGALDALHKAIDDMEGSLRATNYDDPEEGYRKYLDEISFIDYLLSTEFSFNIDGYRLSTNLYKYSDTRAANEGLDSRWKMSLWDFNIAYGNANYNSGERTDLWQYNFNARHNDSQSVPFWWSRMLKDKKFVEQLKNRWKLYRENDYSDERIAEKIDSLTNVLQSGGAVSRNQNAWNIIGRWAWPNAYVGSTYADEINYLKNWIANRVKFMDRNLMPRDINIVTEPVLIKSGWNADVIAEATPASSYTTAAIDMSRTFYSVGLREEGGLPADRIVVSPEGVKYQLAPYNADNALFITSPGDGADLTFDKPISTNELYLLATSTSGAANVEVTVNYDDGTSSDTETYSIRDWSVRQPDGTEALSALGYIYMDGDGLSSDNHYCMFEYIVPADNAKSVKSITVRTAADTSSRPAIFAVSCATKTVNDISGTEVDTDRTIVGIYTINGVKIPAPTKGLNIIKYSDGSVRKVMMR